MAAGFATVKEVLSGDTLVLVGQPKGGPPPEVRVTLAALQAPRLGNNAKNSETKDDPFAWASREFLRRACIGQYVSFKVEYTVPTINRQFGSVQLTGGSKESLGLLVARAGWARVKKDADASERGSEFDELVRLSEQAEQQGLGVFQKEDASAVRDVTYEVKEPEELLKKIKGSPQPALIEYVRDGGSFKVMLLNQMTLISLNLAGVQCPRLNGGSDGAPEPYGPESKYFTEVRLLNRDVYVVVNGLDDRTGNFYGQIEHPAGNIGTELVKHGLARAVDWSMNWCSLQDAAALRGAAKDAKNARLRIWKDYVAPKISGDKSFEGIISEIVSGDTIMVRVGTQEQLAARPWECVERRISFSSLRAPRLGARSRNEPDQPYAQEAREALRQRILGKKCNVSVEYERAGPEGMQPRQFATVMCQVRKVRKNAALVVVEDGFADVIRHRAEDERSAQYDELQAAVVAAKEAGRGMWASNANTEPVQRRVIDLTGNAQQARGHLTSLQAPKPGPYKAGEHRAVVEYVINGSRMRVFLPQENMLLTFALGGILTPQTARSANKGRAATAAEPFATEAMMYTRALALQRDVTVEIETMDKGGNCIGQMYTKRGQERVNLGVALVEAGLARINEYSVNYTPCGDALKREEAEAKRKRLNIWKDYVEPSAEELAAAKAAAALGSLSTMTVCVSEIVNGSTFFAQDQSEASVAKLQAIEKELAAIPADAPGAGEVQISKNTTCLALFDDGSGNKWFRAKILKVVPQGGEEKHALIRYIDYGNEEVVPPSRLRQATQSSMFANPGAAQECELAFVKVPGLDRDYGHEAAVALNGRVFDKTVTAVLFGKAEDGGRLRVALRTGEGEEAEDVGEAILSAGLGYVDSRSARYARGADEKKYIAKLNEAQEKAHTSHVNLWRYGDPRDDDE